MSFTVGGKKSEELCTRLGYILVFSEWDILLFKLCSLLLESHFAMLVYILT